MTRIRRRLLLCALAFAAFLGALVAVRTTTDAPAPAPEAAATVRTSFPDLQPTATEPPLATLDRLSPAPGTIVQAPGPFDDRFVLDGLRLDDAGVHGSARVTSDVSDILEFQALAGFYDKTGRLLGTGRFVYHFDETAGSTAGRAGPPNELQEFTIPLPGGGCRSARYLPRSAFRSWSTSEPTAGPARHRSGVRARAAEPPGGPTSCHCFQSPSRAQPPGSRVEKRRAQPAQSDVTVD